MLDRKARSRTSSFLLLAFTLLILLSQPRLTQSGTVAVMHVLQATTTTTTTTGNMTSTSNQTTSTETASSSSQWDVLIPLLMMGIGAGLAVTVAAVVAVRRRQPRTMPTVQMVCPRCRAPVSPYDAACRNCHTPLYHPHRYYQPRR
jgi:hypothetical protein